MDKCNYTKDLKRVIYHIDAFIKRHSSYIQNLSQEPDFNNKANQKIAIRIISILCNVYNLPIHIIGSFPEDYKIFIDDAKNNY